MCTSSIPWRHALQLAGLCATSSFFLSLLAVSPSHAQTPEAAADHSGVSSGGIKVAELVRRACHVRSRAMDIATVELAETLVTPRYVQAGVESLRHYQGVLRSLVAQRRCPDEGLSDSAIEQLMHQLALMDSNNFAHHIGCGEREGRVVCDLVRRRHYNLTHGTGRSGDLTADQPKAAGSSLLYQLTNSLVLDLLRLAGATSTQAALVVPMATGMTLALALRCVAKQRAQADQSQNTTGSTAAAPRYVLWIRVDQKTALKCIDAAGFQPYPISLDRAPWQREHASRRAPRGGESTASAPMDGVAPHTLFACSRVERLAEAMEKLGGREHVLCVLSTTSCFAPRLPDDTLAIARFCQAQNVAHVVNNAYGVQSRVIMSRLEAAQRLGRVDFVVQSGDKNFLVPVGGAVLSSPSKANVQAAAALYAGRASASPAMDLFMTCLSLGRRGMVKLWRERYRVRQVMAQRLALFAEARGEQLLSDGDGAEVALPLRDDGFPDTAFLPRNDISFAMTMRHYRDVRSGKKGRGGGAGGGKLPDGGSQEVPASSPPPVAEVFAAAKSFGAKLFRSAVTGPRVVCPAPGTVTTIASCAFRSYGVHEDAPPYDCALLVTACGVGMTEEEVEALFGRLEKLWPVDC